MHSKLGAYFRSTRSYQHEPAMYGHPHVDGSVYYQTGVQQDPVLRFIIIRHGERVDKTYGSGWTQHAFSYQGQYYPFDGNMPPAVPVRSNLIDYEADTPLTKNGLLQSWNVGTTLARYNTPVVACYSSPAIRSVQTADQILGGMGRKDIPIRLDLGLFECSSWYAQAPVNFMTDQELLYNGLNIDRQYRSSLKTLRALESEAQYYDRSKEIMKRLIKLHGKTGGTVLIVAHAPSLEVLTRHLMNGNPRPGQLLDISEKVSYCSMTIVDGRPSSSKLWQFRHSLDELVNWNQPPHYETSNMFLQPSYYETSNQFLQPSATVGYHPPVPALSYSMSASQYPYYS